MCNHIAFPWCLKWSDIKNGGKKKYWAQIVYMCYQMKYWVCEFFFHIVSISNQYYGNVQIDGSLVCAGEAFSFNEAAMICRHLGFSDGLPLPSAKLEITFMIGIKCSGSEESISQCNTSSSLCPSVSRWEEKKIGIARVLCYNKSEGSGRYRTYLIHYNLEFNGFFS